MYAHSEVLVDTAWLSDHLADSNLQILEVDISPDLYKEAHIPGAIFWSIFGISRQNLSQPTSN